MPKESHTQFAIVEERLTDGSKVYAVRFFCDYEIDTRVTLDCCDRQHAEELVSALQLGVTCVAVDVVREVA